MPRRSILSEAEREQLRALPNSQDELIRYYTLNELDLVLIKQRRNDHNRLGFAVQLCYLRYPGSALPIGEELSPSLLRYVANQLKIKESCWSKYAQRQETRREHMQILRVYLGLSSFSLGTFRTTLKVLTDVALQTDKGMALAKYGLDYLRDENVIIPPLRVMERLCAIAIAQSNRKIYQNLVEPLSAEHLQKLDALLKLKPEAPITSMTWLRQSPIAPNIKNILEHIERLKLLQSLNLPDGLEKKIHKNRLLKMAREGGRMSVDDLGKFETARRYATIVAIVIETQATVIDEIIDFHDRIIGKLFNRAKRQHEEEFQQSGKAINDKVRLYHLIGNALLQAKEAGEDPFVAIETVISWDDFTKSLREAQKLAQPENFDYLHRIGRSYSQIRRYAPAFLNTLQFGSAPIAKGLLTAIDILKRLDEGRLSNLPEDAPIGFVKKRWQQLVITEKGLDRRFYELCLLSELKNSLRSGDIWVKGSRQFKDFNDYLLPMDEFTVLKQGNSLSLGLVQDCEQYLQDRLGLLEEQLQKVNQMAKGNQLPDVIISESGLKITPLDKAVPEEASDLIQQLSSLLPPIKITELLMEVDEWTNFIANQNKFETLSYAVILDNFINASTWRCVHSCSL